MTAARPHCPHASVRASQCASAMATDPIWPRYGHIVSKFCWHLRGMMTQAHDLTSRLNQPHSGFADRFWGQLNLGRPRLTARYLRAATLVSLLSLSPVTPAFSQSAANDVTGVWLDHTGRGAVEISRCGNGICGRIVWMKNPLDAKGVPFTDGHNPDTGKRKNPICGLQIIGDAKPKRDGSFDEGWIYNPEDGATYSVEVRLRPNQTLRVHGYAGLKFLGETYTWTRAPAQLTKCTVAST